MRTKPPTRAEKVAEAEAAQKACSNGAGDRCDELARLLQRGLGACSSQAAVFDMRAYELGR